MSIRTFLVFTIAIHATAEASARSDWVDPVKGMRLSCGFMDPNYIRTPCTSRGSLGHRNTWRQHLGADFGASVGATVYAPIKGRIVMFDAASTKDPAKAYLVIRDSRTNEEHVIGHISSNLRVGSEVQKGAVIGWVRDQGRNTHVHWGFNVGSVERATRATTRCYRDGKTQTCPWGWGQAPFEASSGNVRDQGWRNVL